MKTKEELLNELIRQDVENYKNIQFFKTGRRELPAGYRKELLEIYGQLNTQGLKELLKIK
ncbi:MAG: hypothetical protein GOVbin4342_62 [Prokaryotic dsDNA virus sp.]|nr:MAG: hypothetical protein GOVbin4342_62 [Prokaryotic dsDNA virus sp.]|tara:strand:- start:1080 stop:1259 length:180 start_codon:yes stop_codon:yes gene_type:complete